MGHDSTKVPSNQEITEGEGLTLTAFCGKRGVERGGKQSEVAGA